MPISQSQARDKFYAHRARAKSRGIEFKLTFEEWRAVWGDKLDQCGVKQWNLGMCRIGDKGAYEVGNVYLGNPARNGASRRMSNENQHGASGRHAGFEMNLGNTYENGRKRKTNGRKETDKEHIIKMIGWKTSSIFS